MRIVLGLADFSTFAGTETYTLTVADELVRLGHEVVVHPETAGPIAEVARARAISVVSDPGQLPPACDAVIAQDAAGAYLLAERYPDARRILVAHSDYFALQSPPQLPGTCHAVVVLNERVRRHVEQLASPIPLIRLRQPVDLKRFGACGGAPQQARRVLVLGNYLRGPAAEMVAAACREAGLEPMLSGAHTVPTHTPEQAIADAEIVIGLGRCVVEAMAGRRAAYVYGIAGGDGWVTPERYAALEADGFGGTASDVVIDRARLAADLAGWDPEMGPRNRQLANGHHDAADHAAELVAQLRALRADDGPPLQHAAELARLVRLEWQSWSRYAGALEENRVLRAALEQSESRRAHEAAAASAEAAAREREDGARRLADITAERDAQTTAADEARRALARERARVEAFRATRRYRLAGRLAAPLDRLRDGGRRG
jgi:hypothetical protein